MKIAFINEYFLPFTPGGAEWSVYYLAKALVKAGHEVMVIMPNYGAVSRELIAGIEVRRFPFPFHLSKGQQNLPYYSHNNFLFYFYSAFWIWKYLRKEKVDIINAQNRYSLIGSFLAAKLLKVPVVFTIRDNNSFCPTGMCTHHFDEKNPAHRCGLANFWQNCSEEYIKLYVKPKNIAQKFFRKLILLYFWLDTQMHQYFMNKSDRIIAISQGILKMYLEARVINSVQTKVIYNLPSSQITISKKERDKIKKKFKIKKEKVVLYAGKFSIGKGTPLLIKVARRVVNKHRDAVFLLVGKGKVRVNDSKIKIYKSISHKEVLKLMITVDLIVVPSNYPEPLSRTLLEGLSLGKVLIGTKVGGTPELIKDNFNGFLINREDEDDLFKKILKILSDSNLRKRMEKNSKEILNKNFKPDKIINSTLNFYQKIIDG